MAVGGRLWTLVHLVAGYTEIAGAPGSRGPKTDYWCSSRESALYDPARLLIQVAPVVFESGVFALKGGTAISLFVRDMPRLSVDLDLVFPDHSLPRDQALAQINEAIRQASARLKTRGFQVRTVTATDHPKFALHQKTCIRLQW